jgi:hypothetical protein
MASGQQVVLSLSCLCLFAGCDSRVDGTDRTWKHIWGNADHYMDTSNQADDPNISLDPAEQPCISTTSSEGGCPEQGVQQPLPLPQDSVMPLD